MLQVQCAPSAVCSKCSVLQVQCAPSAASSEPLLVNIHTFTDLGFLIHALAHTLSYTLSHTHSLIHSLPLTSHTHTFSLTLSLSPPLNRTTSYYQGGPVHLQYHNWPTTGKTIEQSSVALLQYPLGMAIDSSLATNDLAYYEVGVYTPHTLLSYTWLTTRR
jgi:hypothetical protein